MLTTEQLLILLAWEAGELSCACAARLMNTDIVTAREIRQRALEMAAKLWEDFREKNPVTKEVK